MRLIDADAHECWACIHARNKEGVCDMGVFGCDSKENFVRNPVLDRQACVGGPTVMATSAIREVKQDDDVVEAPKCLSKVQRHEDLCLELHDLYDRKNHDYGDSFGETFKEEGLAMARIRLSDKLNRFKTLSRKTDEQHVSSESIRDTLMDLANYALMTVLELE